MQFVVPASLSFSAGANCHLGWRFHRDLHPPAQRLQQLEARPGRRIATDPATITVPPDLRIELLRSAKPEEDSWVSMAFDPQGRLTVACEKRGLLRMTLGPDGVETVERINDSLLECRGLLYADGTLFANAKQQQEFRPSAQHEERRPIRRHYRTAAHRRRSGPRPQSCQTRPGWMLYVVHGNNVVANAARGLRLATAQLPGKTGSSHVRGIRKMFDGDVTLPAGQVLADRPRGRELDASGRRLSQ